MKRRRRNLAAAPYAARPAHRRPTTAIASERGVCRICGDPVVGTTRRGRALRFHMGRTIEGVKERDCRNVQGSCRVCAEPVAIGRNGRPRFWHDGRLAGGEREPNCLHAHKIRVGAAYAKAAIAKRDGARCARCQAAKGRAIKWLHLDHILALADGGTMTEENLQLLCPDCHGDKTAIENSTRAARRKTAKEAA